MKLDTIIRLTDAVNVDINAKGAALQLAWHRTAQDMWSRREFGTDHRTLFAQHLRAAHADIAHRRRYQRAAAVAQTNPRVIALRAELEDLYVLPFGMHIGQRVAQIDAEIATLTRRTLCQN